MENIYIGVYGTSDKTQVKVERVDGTVIGYGEAESANIHLSVKHAWDAILRAVKFALKKEDISVHSEAHSFNMGLGLKYTELAEACIDFKKAKPTNFGNVILKSDGYVLCMGAHKKDGAIIIVDEGIVGNAIHNGSDSHKVGGWGFPHADSGSFPWIGVEAIRLTLQWIDGYIKPSPMLEAIFDHFDRDVNKLVLWAMQTRTYPNEYQIICDIVISFLKSKDVYAEKLIKHTADEVEKVYNILSEKTKNINLPCCLYGYLAPVVQPFLSEHLRKNLTHANGDGLTGALKLIRG